MIPYLVYLPLLFSIIFAIAWVSYQNKIDSYLGMGICIIGNMFIGLLWLLSCKLIREPTRVFIFSMWWDVIVMLSFTLYPLLFSNLKFTTGLVSGCVLVVLGLVIIKLNS